MDKKLFILLYRFWTKLSFSCRENLEVANCRAKNRLCRSGTARLRAGLPPRGAKCVLVVGKSVENCRGKSRVYGFEL